MSLKALTLMILMMMTKVKAMPHKWPIQSRFFSFAIHRGSKRQADDESSGVKMFRQLLRLRKYSNAYVLIQLS